MGIEARHRYVALLRGINVGGRNRVNMAVLRTVAVSLRCTDVKTFIASGNLVFTSSDGDADALAQRLRGAVAERCMVDVPIIVMPASRFSALASTMPFSDVPEEGLKLVHLGFLQGSLPTGALPALLARSNESERVVVVRDALWIDYGGGVKTSRLTSAAVDVAAGAPVTMRNVKTVTAIGALL